jgi:hypothetical protein
LRRGSPTMRIISLPVIKNPKLWVIIGIPSGVMKTQ